MTSPLVNDVPANNVCRDTLVVIPALNEAQTVGTVVADVVRLTALPVIVVDDASNDGTGTAARAAGAGVIRLPVRQGAWGAIQTGMRYALRSGYCNIVTMDADGQHDADSVRRLLEPVRSGAVNVSIGLCLGRGTLLRRIAWTILRRLSAVNIEDLTSGFRTYDRAAAEILTSRPATLLSYQDVGVLILLRNHHMRIAEVDVPMYGRRSGVSRIYHSWIAVLNYLSQTFLLSISKISLSWEPPKRPATGSTD